MVGSPLARATRRFAGSSVEGALCRLYHGIVFSTAECGETERGFYYIIGYTTDLSNKPHTVRTPGTPRGGPELETQKLA